MLWISKYTNSLLMWCDFFLFSFLWSSSFTVFLSLCFLCVCFRITWSLCTSSFVFHMISVPGKLPQAGKAVSSPDKRNRNSFSLPGLFMSLLLDAHIWSNSFRYQGSFLSLSPVVSFPSPAVLLLIQNRPGVLFLLVRWWHHSSEEILVTSTQCPRFLVVWSRNLHFRGGTFKSFSTWKLLKASLTVSTAVGAHHSGTRLRSFSRYFYRG